jgi:hypothetical protein
MVAKVLSLFVTHVPVQIEIDGAFTGHKRADEFREPQGYEMCDMSTKALQFISLVPLPIRDLEQFDIEHEVSTAGNSTSCTTRT